jgi:hypothetical protein
MDKEEMGALAKVWRLLLERNASVLVLYTTEWEQL